MFTNIHTLHVKGFNMNMLQTLHFVNSCSGHLGQTPLQVYAYNTSNKSLLCVILFPYSI